MADICLVSLPTLGRATSTIVPHWMLWLAGYIEKQGYGVDIVDVKSKVNENNTEIEKERIINETLEKIKDSKSPIIGLSGFTEEFFDLINFARQIKKISNSKIIVGGIHASILPKDFYAIDDTPIDGVIAGDGEIPLVKLFEAEYNNMPWENIDGLIFKRGNQIIQTAPQNTYPPLDDMPILPYHKLNMDFYLQPQQFLTRWIYLSGVHIFTARGCPFQCTFCANRRKKVRYRPIDMVVNEIQWLKETYDIDGFYIHDDTFTINQERVLSFCEKLETLKYKYPFVWGMEGRVNQFPDNIFRALKASGCIQIDFGVESGSQAALNRMKKGIKVEDTIDIFRRCRSSNIRTFANILINTPEETEEDIKKTINLMEKITATEYGIGVTTPFPGTEIYDQYVKPPLSIDEYELYKDRRTYTSIVDPRFQMAVHQLDMGLILDQMKKQFQMRGWQIISLHPRYLKAIIMSKRKIQYLNIFAFRLLRRLRNLLRAL